MGRFTLKLIVVLLQKQKRKNRKLKNSSSTFDFHLIRFTDIEIKIERTIKTRPNQMEPRLVTSYTICWVCIIVDAISFASWCVLSCMIYWEESEFEAIFSTEFVFIGRLLGLCGRQISIFDWRGQTQMSAKQKVDTVEIVNWHWQTCVIVEPSWNSSDVLRYRFRDQMNHLQQRLCMWRMHNHYWCFPIDLLDGDSNALKSESIFLFWVSTMQPSTITSIMLLLFKWFESVSKWGRELGTCDGA